METPTEIKYSLRNAPAATPAPRPAFIQGQRYWIERALQQGKQDVGLGDYPVRGARRAPSHGPGDEGNAGDAVANAKAQPTPRTAGSNLTSRAGSVI